MSQEQTTQPSSRRSWIVPMRPRSPDEAHRVATPLELFFDLVFVVAVAQAGAALHHSLAEGHFAQAIASYLAVFFAIWWAWVNFTSFASAYDCDDVPYRLAVFVQLAGALILAAGVQRAFETGDYGITVTGYVVMRLALIAQWLRAARSDPPRRATAYRFVLGIAACQAGWVALLFVRAAWYPIAFVGLGVVELLVPVWAARAAATTWHPGHLTERFGLFTIIVLGEAIVATALGLQSALDNGGLGAGVVSIIVGGLLILFALWWFYFDWPMRDMLGSLRTAFIWGYGHLFVFASAAAVGAGLGVEIDRALHHAEIGALASGATVAVPVATFIIALWGLHVQLRTATRLQIFLIPVVAVLVLLTPSVTGQAALLTGSLLVVLLAIKLASRYRAMVQPTASTSPDSSD